MTMNRKSNGTLAAHDAEHKRVSLDLPWYINGTLDPVEHGRVAAHIAGCLVCRRELSALGALDRAVANRDREPQVEAALGRLHQRIAATSGPKPYFPWAAAAVLAIVAGIGGFVGINSGLVGGYGAGTDYTTLGVRTIGAAADPMVTARIVFKRGVTEQQLRDLLLDAQAELIDGPTPRGAYTIALPQVVRGDDLQNAVVDLRASERVLFVEPIVSIRPPARDD